MQKRNRKLECHTFGVCNKTVWPGVVVMLCSIQTSPSLWWNHPLHRQASRGLAAAEFRRISANASFFNSKDDQKLQFSSYYGAFHVGNFRVADPFHSLFSMDNPSNPQRPIQHPSRVKPAPVSHGMSWSHLQPHDLSSQMSSKVPLLNLEFSIPVGSLAVFYGKPLKNR